MTQKEYAEKILSFDEKEKALLFVIDNYFTEVGDEEGKEKEQSKFIKETIKSSEELIKLKENIYNYFDEIEKTESDDSDEKINKYDVSEEEANKFAEILKLDWFEEEE